MEGQEILNILQRDRAVGPTLRGVCSIDEPWPEPVMVPASYVINTDTKTGPGEHWVAFYISADGHCDYFESLGTAPIRPIWKWLKKRTKSVIFNKQWLQSPVSEVCGHYCIYFLRARARGRSLGDILTDFQEYDFEQNDNKVRNKL